MNEKLKNTLRSAEWLLVPLVLVAGSFLGGTYYGEHRAFSEIETRSDTVTKVVTVYKDRPQAVKTGVLGYVSVPTYRFIADTIDREKTVVLRDTTVQYIYLPREQKYYAEADGKLRIWVSGYEPALDRYELDLPTTTITNTKTIKPSRWGLSISGGYGAALVGKTVEFTPCISVGISYTFLRF